MIPRLVDTHSRCETGTSMVPDNGRWASVLSWAPTRPRPTATLRCTYKASSLPAEYPCLIIPTVRHATAKITPQADPPQFLAGSLRS